MPGQRDEIFVFRKYGAGGNAVSIDKLLKIASRFDALGAVANADVSAAAATDAFRNPTGRIVRWGQACFRMRNAQFVERSEEGRRIFSGFVGRGVGAKQFETGAEGVDETWFVFKPRSQN